MNSVINFKSTPYISTGFSRILMVNMSIVVKGNDI